MPGTVPQLTALEKMQLRQVPLASFRPGDSVRVHYRIIEGEKTRIQKFQGVVIRVKGKHGHSRSTFTVRKVSYGIGVERTFLYNSPRLEEVEVLSSGKVRRSRLYYMRELHGKSAKLRERLTARQDAATPEGAGEPAAEGEGDQPEPTTEE